MKVLKLGSRPSKMALYQAYLVKDLLSSTEISIEIVPMKSQGDFIHGDLSKHGGKGAFVSTLDEAIIKGEIDFSVNCLKDIPNDHERSEGIKIVSVLKRGDPREALLCRPNIKEKDLFNGDLIIGTSAPRRKAILSKLYPNCSVVHFRGSADTRIEKLRKGDVDAIILASSGLDRIDNKYPITKLYTIDIFPPAIGSGVVTIDCHENSKETVNIISKLNHAQTFREVTFERSLVNNLRGNCNTAISMSFNYLIDGRILIKTILYSNTRDHIIDEIETELKDPKSDGYTVASNLLQKGAREIIDTEKWFF